MATQVPTRPPDEQWEGSFTDPTGNQTGVKHNKRYWIKLWQPDTVLAEWGKVNSAKQRKLHTRHDAESYYHDQIVKKKRKGYVEVLQGTEEDILDAQRFLGMQIQVSSDTAKTAQSLDPKVYALIQMLMEESGTHIKSYLKASIDDLSFKQLRRAQAKIEEIAKAHRRKDKSAVSRSIVEYLNIIPTKLPLKPDMDEIIEAFVQQFEPKPVRVANSLLQVLAEPQEDRIHQMMSALANRKTRAPQQNVGAMDTVTRQYWLLGTHIIPIDQGTETWSNIKAYISRTLPSRHIEGMFQLHIPIERSSFEQQFAAIGNVWPLFHGTHTANGIHILKTGLIIPKSHAHGSRFGRGIYFGDKAQRSYNYTEHTSRNSSNILFINDVALGKMKTSSKTMDTQEALRYIRQGYGSVWGVGTNSNMGDEYIVYNTNQQTARAIVLLA